ncbi:hypothetical protein [Ammoniphilus sp. YIM 78166]|nr:hypothetical protein [Ammoniphilus sp. YIM 78166]
MSFVPPLAGIPQKLACTVPIFASELAKVAGTSPIPAGKPTNQSTE